MASYDSYHTARAEMMERLGDGEGAIDAIGTALALVDSDVERRGLERRLSPMQG